ncbi:MAG: NADH-quinone oxidoreductase subunit M, partial [Gammaproteobacteria bacterium]|nr:NADH-quinone oxidoreductase subunit M [Gammaproteobacteria bacterium]
MSNVGLPGTSGFVGEWLIILSSFKANFWVTLLASTTLILAAAYTLWMYKRVFFGEIKTEAVANLREVRFPEMLALFVLAALILAIGFYPLPILNVFHASVGHLLQLATTSKLI